METNKKSEKDVLAEIKAEYLENNKVLSDLLQLFSTTVAPYMIHIPNLEKVVKEDTNSILASKQFFRLNSCTVEDINDAFLLINGKIEKLLVALHSLDSEIIYGVISRGGQSHIVLGVDYDKKNIARPIIEGLLTGIDIEERNNYEFSKKEDVNIYGGFISAVPIVKDDEEKQQFDFSSLMKCLNGEDYNFLIYAIPRTDGEELYSTLLQIKDSAFAVSRRNLSIQNSVNNTETKTETLTTNRRGVIQELANQIVREHKFDFGGVVDAFIDAGIHSRSEAVSTATTLEGVSKGESFDIQNSVAVELADYCDKAIERIKHGMSTGLWNYAISYSATTEKTADILKSCIIAEIGKPTEDVIPFTRIDYPEKKNCTVLLPQKDDKNNPLLVPVTSKELGAVCTPPTTPVPDFEIRKGRLYPMIPSDEGVYIGEISDGQRAFTNMPFALSERDLNKHTFVCGITGSGKTTTVKTILRGLSKPYLVIESAKKEYRNLEGIKEVYTMGKPEINCIQMNPFYVQCGINLQTHIDYLKDLFNASFSFYGPMPYIIEKCLGNIYKKKGWNLTLGYHPSLINIDRIVDIFDATYMRKQYSLKASQFLFPTMYDLKEEVKRYIEKEMQYEGEVAGNIKSAILSRLESLCVGAKGYMFNTHNCINMESVMKTNSVFELEGLADDSDKAFCVGLLVVFINEFRQVEKELDKTMGLKHLLVIEEAHRLLKNVDTEKTSENMGNPKGKAVEHFTNMIAEMRSYGQGVIIAEQIPSKLAPDVIKNSSNKIVQRIVSADDQEIISNTIGITVQDSMYLGNLRNGYALCHKEGMNLPVLVKVHGKNDPQISDGDVIAEAHKDMTETFDKINEQMVTENLNDHLDSIALKLLNTLMVMDDQTVAKDVRNTRGIIKNELIKREIVLLPMTNDRLDRLFGDILANRILILLNYGRYSFKQIMPNSLTNELSELLIKGTSEKVLPVKKHLTELYKTDCYKRCCEIVAEDLINNHVLDINMDRSIRSYFYSVSEEIVNEITGKTKGA